MKEIFQRAHGTQNRVRVGFSGNGNSMVQRVLGGSGLNADHLEELITLLEDFGVLQAGDEEELRRLNAGCKEVYSPRPRGEARGAHRTFPSFTSGRGVGTDTSETTVRLGRPCPKPGEVRTHPDVGITTSTGPTTTIEERREALRLNHKEHDRCPDMFL